MFQTNRVFPSPASFKSFLSFGVFGSFCFFSNFGLTNFSSSSFSSSGVTSGTSNLFLPFLASLVAILSANLLTYSTYLCFGTLKSTTIVLPLYFVPFISFIAFSASSFFANYTNAYPLLRLFSSLTGTATSLISPNFWKSSQMCFSFKSKLIFQTMSQPFLFSEVLINNFSTSG